MTLIVSLAVAVLFASGAYLLLKPDLIRVVAGMVLISNAANLFIMSAGLTKGVVPIHPLPVGKQVADPLVQAMTLTAVVISFGVTALLLGIVYRVYLSHRSVDVQELAEAEEYQATTEEETLPVTSEEETAPQSEEDEILAGRIGS